MTSLSIFVLSHVVGLPRTNFMTGPRFARVVWRSARGQVGRYRRDRIR